MNVSKKSWHYNIVDSIFRKPSNSLCVYFWQIIGAILAYMCIAAAAIAAIFLVAFCIVTPLFALWAIFIHGFENVWNENYYYIDIVVSGMVIMFFATVLGICKGIEFAFRKIRNIDSEPNIATEYIRAKKEKVCPRITFK